MCLEIKELLHLKGHSGLYATVDIGTATIASTSVLPHQSANPIWNETFHIHCAYTSPSLVISVKKELDISAQVVGRAEIPISEILSGKVIEGWYDLYNEDFSKKLKKAQIHACFQFKHVSEDPYWGSGIRDRNFPGVQHVYFKQREGCRVNLYQNTHLSEHYRSRIELGYGEERTLYRPARLWEELYQYIDGAKKFIYIAGWSVNTKITLVKDKKRMIPGAEGVTLGKLLKKKADQGVRVLHTAATLFAILLLSTIAASMPISLSAAARANKPAGHSRKLGSLVEEPAVVLTYHNGPLLTSNPGSLDVHLISYAKFSPAQRSIVGDFLQSLSRNRRHRSKEALCVCLVEYHPQIQQQGQGQAFHQQQQQQHCHAQKASGGARLFAWQVAQEGRHHRSGRSYHQVRSSAFIGE